MKTTHLLPLLAVCGLALRLTAPAQTLSVSSLEPSGNQLTITVRNTGTATSFQLQGSGTMAAASWGPVTATFSPVAGQAGFFRATINQPAAGRFFYRVIGLSGTAEDLDGDGLANTLETLAGTGTNPNLFDTDGDGFSDGIEYASGTDPLNALSRPNFGLPPTVNFAESDVAAVEGTTVTIPLIFDRPFTGTVPYQVLTTRSSASAPADYATLSGSVAVTNGLGDITLTTVDDLDYKDQRLLFIMLTPPAGTAYATGAKDFLSIRFVDNDDYWNGALRPAASNEAAGSTLVRNFRMKLARNAGGPQVAFVAGPPHDGLPSLPTVVGQPTPPPSNQTEGMIPPGFWPATVVGNSPVLFSVSSPSILLPTATGSLNTGGSLFGEVADLRRTVTLVADPVSQPNAAAISEGTIVGTWTENVTSESSPFLNRSNTGVFVMVKSTPVLAPLPANAP